MADEQKPKVDRAAAIKAWHDAKDDAGRTAAVKEHPVLLEIYATAQHHKPKAESQDLPDKTS